MTATDLALPVVIDEPGFYEMSDELYFADPVLGGSWSQSDVKAFRKADSPAAYRWALDHPKGPNSGMSLGTYVHAEIMDQPIEVAEYTGKSKTWTAADSKAFREAAIAEGKVPLLPTELAAGRQMVAALRAHSVAMEAIKGREGERVAYELAGFAPDPVTGLWLRSKFDILGETSTGAPAIRDLKTTAHGMSADALSKTIFDYGYHVQAAAYRHVVSLLTDVDVDEIEFTFVFVSSAEPHSVAVVDLPQRALDLGAETFHGALEQLARCIKTNHWPSLGDGKKVTIDLPGWAYRR